MTHDVAGLIKLKKQIHASLAADGHEDRVELGLDKDNHRLIIKFLTDKYGQVMATTGEMASIMRKCFRAEGKENNIWVSGYSPDQYVLIIRLHPSNR